MNEMQIFRNESFGIVRTLKIDNEVFFVGKDVSDALGYQRPDNAIRAHVDEEDKLMHQISATGQNRNMMVINESGMYSLVLSSKLLSARKFKRWVTREVLPSIRKHGAYMTSETIEKALLDPDTIIQLATTLKEERAKSQALHTENKLLSQETLKWADRKLIEAIVKKVGGATGYQDAWREFKKELLYKHSINLNARITHYLNNTGKKTKPKTLDMIHDSELQACISTAIALSKSHKVNISDILSKLNESEAV